MTKAYASNLSLTNIKQLPPNFEDVFMKRIIDTYQIGVAPKNFLPRAGTTIHALNLIFQRRHSSKSVCHLQQIEVQCEQTRP